MEQTPQESGAGTHTFRMRWLPLWMGMSIAAVALTFGYLAMLGKLGRTPMWWIAAAELGLLAAAAWIMQRCFTVLVREEDLSGPDFYGRRVEVPFSEIVAVSELRLPLVPFLRLRCEEGHDLWLPGFLGEAGAFYDLVLNRLDGDHPTRAFWEAQRGRTAKTR